MVEASEIRQFLAAISDQSGVSGISVALIAGNASVAVAVGKGVDGSKQRLSHQSAFDVGCVGKLFIALLVLRLVEDGLITPEDSVLDHLPDLPLRADIRIKHLLSHTSGFRSPELTHPSTAHEMTWVQFIRALGESDQLFKPGDVFSYSRVEYVMLGEIIRRTVGMHPVSAFTEWVLEPMGLRRRLRGHSAFSGIVAAGEAMLGIARSKTGTLTDALHPFWSLAGSGVALSVPELAKIMDVALQADARRRRNTKLPVAGSLSLLRAPQILLPRFVDNTGGFEELPEAFGLCGGLFAGGVLGHSGTSKRHCIAVRHLYNSGSVAVAVSSPMPHVRDIVIKRLLPVMPANALPAPGFLSGGALPFGVDELAGVYVGGGPQQIVLRRSAERLTAHLGSGPPFVTFEIGSDGDVRLVGRRLLLPVAFYRERSSGIPCVNLGLHAFKRIGGVH